MTTFGDYDPDDAWDAADGFRAHVVNLLHRLDYLEAHVVLDVDDDMLARLERFRTDLVTVHNAVVDVVRYELGSLGLLERIVLP